MFQNIIFHFRFMSSLVKKIMFPLECLFTLLHWRLLNLQQDLLDSLGLPRKPEDFGNLIIKLFSLKLT